MEQLRRPLLRDGHLAPIPEADVEKSSAETSQPMSLPADVGSSSSDYGSGGNGDQMLTTGGKRGGRGRERSTWGGTETKHSHRKPKRVTDLSPRTEITYPDSLMSYNIHEEGYGLDPTFHQRQGSEVSSHTSSFSEGAGRERLFSDSGGVIDGRFSLEGGHDFVRIESPFGDDGMSTTKELERCKKTVLTPYLTFLKVIGWRRWRGARQDLAVPYRVRVLNIVYPSIIFFLMAVATTTQLLTCFYRDEEHYTMRDEETQVLVVECSDHIVTRTVVGDLLLLGTYLLGLYLFRYGEPEHFSALMERVYLSFNFKHRVSPQKRLTIILRLFLFLGVVWILVSLAGSILRLFSLQLLSSGTYIRFITFQNISNISQEGEHMIVEDVLRYACVIYSIFGFILFDLLYVAVVLTYVSQTQLLLTYINSVIEKVQTKAYSLGEAIRDMRLIYDFLRVLNGKLANLTSLCLFIFVSATISSLIGLTEETTAEKTYSIGIAVGVVNFAQWSILLFAPLTQAARLTSYCRRLRRLGLEIGARPFSYQDTPQLVLDSFLQYTTSTKYTAKLASVPIYAGYLIGFLFVFGILAIWSIATFNLFTFAPWF